MVEARDYQGDVGRVSGLNGHAHPVTKIVHEVKNADDKLVTFVRERPVVAVCTAMAVGYLIGRVFTRFG
jgi:ElaB/YqjD/DUF883 family membrane-anchored ribosome-binding protein